MVLQILVSAQTQQSSCPICLSTPVAPRMAKCGHVFCLPCLIRYMHSSDESNPLPEKKARWQKCPICWDSVYISEARPVRWYVGPEGEAPHEGGDVLLRLLSRQAGSTLALPKDSCEVLAPLEDVPWCHVAEVIDYARVMKGGEDYMNAEYDAEINELQRQEREDELMFGDDNTWTRKAVVAVREAIERVSGIGNPPTAPTSPVEKRKGRAPIKFEVPDEGVPEMYSILHAVKSGQSSSGESGSPFRTPSASEPVSANASTQFVNLESQPGSENPRPFASLPSRRGSNSAGPSRSPFNTRSSGMPHNPQYPFYFYQALPHYYLSPLDIRILRTAFGDFSQFPSTVLPRVEHVSTGHIVDDDLRKRAKYLAHLPYGCEVSFLECDWRDLVSAEILGKFQQEIERRRRRNREKETREEKERVRAEKEEDDKRWAAARRKRPSIVDKGFSDQDFQPLAQGSSPVDTSLASASPPYASHHGTTSKFASLASPSTSPVAARTIWGTAAVAPLSPPMEPVAHHSDNPDDGWLQGWEKDLLGDDELVAQVQKTSLGEEEPIPKPNGTAVGSGKKKKNKKIMLMSTSNARRGA
jgi:Zinc finger, C3HC4 type (RING finger)